MPTLVVYCGFVAMVFVSTTLCCCYGVCVHHSVLLLIKSLALGVVRIRYFHEACSGICTIALECECVTLFECKSLFL